MGNILRPLAFCCLVSSSNVCGFAPTIRFTHRSISVSPGRSVLQYADDENVFLDKSTTKREPFEPWKMFDFNQDGKVDTHDLAFLVTRSLDINKDGKIDEKDAQVFLSAAILSWALMVSPAYAKGGGGGGGHFSSSASSSAPSYAPYRRPYRRSSNKWSTTYRPTDPLACSDLPVQNELLDVLVDKNRGTYATGVVTTVDENHCRFQADLVNDGGFSQYRGRRKLSSHRNFLDWILPASIATAAAACTAAEMVDRKWDHTFDDDFFGFESELTLNTTVSRPESGRYVGSTSESDGMNQNVATILKFDESGGITGSGKDSYDGSYKVVGTWNNRKVRWTERYADFETTVRGEIDHQGLIKCRFHSSRGVRGRFDIQKKNSWKKWW